MDTPTRSQPEQDDLTALLTVMDTLEAFQWPDSRRHPDELAQRVRTLYRAQNLPLEEDALERAVALYADPTWTRPAPAPVPLAPVPASTSPAPSPEPPAQVVKAPVPHPDMDPEGAKAGAIAFTFVLIMSVSLGWAMLRVPTPAVSPSTPSAHPPTELAFHLVQQVQATPEDAQRWFQTREAEVELATYQMKGVFTALPGGGTRLTLAHADPEVLRAMAGPLQRLTSPQTPVRIRLDGQDVIDLTQVYDPVNTAYIERASAPQVGSPPPP